MFAQVVINISLGEISIDWQATFLFFDMLQLFLMMDKRSRIKKVIISVAILAALFAGYFYLPSFLGDSVLPLKYQDSIRRWSKEYNEDPFLVAAIIMQESGYNPKAQSPVGAMGLMQIMPGTAKGIASGTEYPNYTVDKLYDPEVSIQFGTWYIHVLKEKYDGNVTAALAAYNAGSGNADKWIRMGLLNTPSDNSYAYKVQNLMSAYHNLYEDQLSSDAPLPDINQPIVKKTDTNTRNIIWGQTLKNLVAVFYGMGQ